MDLEGIINNCIESSINYGVSAYEIVVNSKKINKLYDRQYKNFKILKNHPKGTESLYRLIEHHHMYVRYTSAIHLLSVNEKKAKEVILEVATLSKDLELDSFYLLQEWENGNLKDYYN
ncbi:DUF2019 domain-containing protein [Bacillus salipaludis]|uniref:DUF2019 domain-containing protein n=1 Tax=Bacillus salipaludis TaxID=2547811 RepID=A0A4V3ATV0_9BACI|nr:DUF2019 domain-containing protein [Bacillus salipaludis]TDK61743.1 DUF2019 domain-containing protein [Bacillus salipaludis]